MNCGSIEALVGSIRTHSSTSPRIGPRRRRQGRRPESKTLDDSKQTMNWGQSVQSIHEEVGTGGQCSMECGEEVVTDRQCSMECGEEVGTERQCSM